MSYSVDMENIQLEIQRIKDKIQSLEVRENAATKAEERISIGNQIAALVTKEAALVNEKAALVNQQTEVMKLSAGMAQKRLSSTNSPFPRNPAQPPLILTSYRLIISVLTLFNYFHMTTSSPSLHFALRSPQPLPQVNVDAV